MENGHKYAHAEGEYYGQTISIDGGRWEVEVDTFLDRALFPSSYYGEVCDISIQTGSASINFFMNIGNVIKLNEAIKICMDRIAKNALTAKTIQEEEERRFSISNININGKWYSVGDLDMSPRTPFKTYISFVDKNDGVDTDGDADIEI